MGNDVLALFWEYLDLEDNAETEYSVYSVIQCIILSTEIPEDVLGLLIR